MSRIRLPLIFLGLGLFLSSCAAPSKPSPTAAIRPTTAPSQLPSPTATFPSVTVTLPAGTATLELVQETAQPIPYQISTLMPSPLPGWKTYVNEYLGYQFSYPSSIAIHEQGSISLSDKDIIPTGFTFSEYYSYLDKVLPDNLCVSLESNAGWVTIGPPGESIGRFIEPCPGMGLGPYSRMEDISEDFQVNGRNYALEGKRIYFEGGVPEGNDLFIFYVDGGFRITFSATPQKGVGREVYSEQREILKKVLSTVSWTKIPDLTIPGTTCAGKFTQLVPGTIAQVSPGDNPNRVRKGPSKADEVIAQIYPATIVKVIEGPACADGLVFWKVANKSIPGGAGWTAEGDGKEYYLIPYLIEAPAVKYAHWPRYVSTVYGFSFAYPPEWKVSELSTNFIQISSSDTPDIKLTIGVRWADEDARIQRTGVPEGDIVTVGKIIFLGQEISKDVLKYQSKDKKILYANGIEIRIGDRVFTLGLDDFSRDYDAVDLSNVLEQTADAIVESIAYTK
jgi:hypothetical protein